MGRDGRVTTQTTTQNREGPSRPDGEHGNRRGASEVTRAHFFKSFPPVPHGIPNARFSTLTQYRSLHRRYCFAAAAIVREIGAATQHGTRSISLWLRVEVLSASDAGTWSLQRLHQRIAAKTRD